MQQQRQAAEDHIVHLQTIRARRGTSYRHFGALIGSARRDAGVHQPDIEKAYLEWSQKEALAKLGIQFKKGRKVQPLTAKTYGKLERNEQPPKFDQLLVLYIAMTAGCGIDLSGEELDFVELARQKIAAKTGQYQEKLTEQDWLWLEEQIAKANGESTSSREHIHLLEKSTVEVEQRAKTLAHLTIDTSHIIGRDHWLTQMLSYLKPENTAIRKKVIVIQAALGAGKTSCLKLLQKQVLEHIADARVLLHECKISLDPLSPHQEKTPEEHLDALLAHLTNDLQPEQAERHEAPSTMERIRLLLQALGEVTTRLIILIDDAQVLLSQDGELSSGWQHVLNEVIEHHHQATLFITTRVWPGWTKRSDSYFFQTDLSPLSPETCIQVWKQLGYAHESEDILCKAAALCGYNPRMMEIVAQHMKKPILAASWSSWQEALDTDGQQGLACFVKDPHSLSNAMIDAYPLLDEIVTTRLSSDARQLLTLLAVSVLPLPAPLLTLFIRHPQRCIKELIRVSLLARDPDRLRLLPLVAESVLQQLSQGERRTIEDNLITAYSQWMREGRYHDEQEQAAVIAELTLLHLKHQHLLEAAEFVIGYGWLLFAASHAQRIARAADTSLRSLQGYSVENEAGNRLLRLRLKRFLKVSPDAQRGRAYAQLYEMMSLGRVQFKPRTTLYIIHHQLRSQIRQQCHSLAYSLIKEECHRNEELQRSDPITYVELLDRQAYVAGRWGDFLEREGDFEKALKLRSEAVQIHQQCIDQLSLHEDFAPPLLHSHILYQKARMLHDLSFYERVLGDEKALIHIEECLSIKTAGYSVPGSLAITYDDYAHLLAKQGKYQQALHYNDLALQLTQPMVEANLSDASSQKGMLLVNRGKLLLQFKHFEDAYIHFTVGKSLVEGTPRHDLSFPAAEAGLSSLEEERRVNPKGHLDHQWFARYQDLASYSDVKWLAQAGPFTPEEQQEWDTLRERGDEESHHRLSLLIAKSGERELVASFQEQREPHLHYPLIPLEIIAEKATGLSRLRTEVERDETNILVRQLYLDAIDERLNELAMIEATGLQNDEAFWTCTQRLYALPKAHEMELAMRPLAQLLHKGLRKPSTAELAAHIIEQTQSWSIDLMSLTETEQEYEQSMQGQVPLGSCTHGYFSPQAVQGFFEEVFHRYQFAWRVLQDPSTDHPRVSLTSKQLILPVSTHISSAHIREILAHEVEMHAFRSVAGEKSRLLLLSLGLAHFLETEEGLATYCSIEAARFGASKPDKTWIGTLATGLAAGIVSRPYSFHTLRSFLVNMFTLRGRLAAKKTPNEIEQDALKYAHKRCLRTWRGVSNLSHPGICATKDSIYLRGYLAVCEKLQQEPATFDRLLVGSVGLQHLDALSELGITEPHVRHQRLAYDTNLESYITQFVNANITK
jgi:tetratricopeptide (TPR) repeat protein